MSDLAATNCGCGCDAPAQGGENVGRLVIDGNAVYEIDEECERRKKENRPQKEENTERTNRKGGR